MQGYHLGSLSQSRVRRACINSWVVLVPAFPILSNMHARDRTTHWVQTHTSHAEFYSPSSPPSDIDDYSPPDSDAGSFHSLPPRMMLRYGDGRADIPIPHQDGRNYHAHGHRQDDLDSRSRHDARRMHGSHRTSAHAGPPVAGVRSRALRDPAMLGAPPEEIHVLPSNHGSRPSVQHGGHNSRAHSQSRTSRHHPGSFVPVSHAYPSNPSRQRHPHPGGHVPSASMTHMPGANYGVYPPVNGFHHPHQVAPNGVIYSHSAPPILIRQGHPNATHYPHTGAPEHRHGMPVPLERSRARSRSLSGRSSRPLVVDESDVSSSDSESHYAPRGRSKKTFSTPSPDKSVTTATSSGRYPVTPSSKNNDKRPFFQRLFHFAGKISHAGSSRASSVTGEGGVHRRHSIGGVHRLT